MVITTSSIYQWDTKHVLWKLLKDQFQELEAAYPTKVNVKVTKSYPQLVEELDKYLALITVSRVSAPQETLFVGDAMTSGLNSDGKYAKKTGALNTDYYEIAIWSLDPDYRDQMYYIVRQIMLEQKLYLAQQGFTKIIRTGGGDQEVDLVGIPRIIYRGIHMYMIQAQIAKEDLYDVASTIHVTQTVRVEIDSSENEATETSIVPLP